MLGADPKIEDLRNIYSKSTSIVNLISINMGIVYKKREFLHSSPHSTFVSDLTRKLLASSSLTSLLKEKGKKNYLADKWNENAKEHLLNSKYVLKILNRARDAVIQNLSMASVLEIRASSLDVRNSQKLLRFFSRQNLQRWRRKSLNCFGSCQRQKEN